MTLPHRSAVVAWLSWSIGFAVSAVENPRLLVEIATLSPRLLPIPVAIALFIVAVGALQREMGLALKASSFGEPRRLVTTGTFAVSRNPIYLAFFLPLASLAVCSVVGAAVGILAYFTIMTVFVIKPEEDDLRRAFGAEFDAWAARTPRWIALGGRERTGLRA